LSLPWLSANEQINFPSVYDSTEEGIVAVGGNLSPGVLLSAYRQGIFPWYNEGDEILWWSPDPRFVLFTDKLKISRSMKKEIRKLQYQVTLDHSFKEVIENCSNVRRRGQGGTWITKEMIAGYCELNRLGWTHSVEVRNGEGILVAGLYGVSMGHIFFGESMFTTVSNGSKIAFIYLTLFLKDRGFRLIDCQDHTNHLESLGAENISRKDFYQILNSELSYPDFKGMWSDVFPDFPDSVGYGDLIK